MPKPIPVPNELTKPFWDAANQRRLVLQWCDTCRKFQYPPRPACQHCGSADNLRWRGAAGKGHILEYYVINDSRLAPIQKDQPVNFAVITLDQDPGINFFSNLPGTPIGEVPVGEAVHLIFRETGSGQLIHEWEVTQLWAAPNA